jgi:hypothetical protein
METRGKPIPAEPRRASTSGRGSRTLRAPAHSAAIEAVINEGGLDDPENDLR